MRRSKFNYLTWATTLATMLFISVAGNAATPQDSGAGEKNVTATGSVMRVPQSAGFYVATMNHESVVEAVTQSNAWASLKKSDVWKGMKKAYRRGKSRGYADYNRNNPFSEYLQAYGDTVDNVFFKTGWEIVKQVIQDEVFFYVDNNAIPLSVKSREFQAELMQLLSADGFEDFDETFDAAMAKKLVNLIKSSFDDLDCPTVVLGAQLRDPEGFRGLLTLAKSGIEQGLNAAPDEFNFVKDFYKVIDNKRQFLLMLDIDMAKLPWDELLRQIDIEDEQVAQILVDTLSTKKATVAMGIVDNLLILGIAKDQTQLAEFGAGEKMIDLEFAQPLRDAVNNGEKLLMVSYVSREFADSIQTGKQALDAQKYLIKPLIDQVDEFPDDKKDAIVAEIESLVDELGEIDLRFSAKPGQTIGFVTLKPDGIHGYSRQKTGYRTVDGSKPLNFAKHAGPDTVAFFSQRSKNGLEQYDAVSKWFVHLYRFGRQTAMDLIEGEIDDSDAKDIKLINLFLDDVESTFSDIDKTTRELLIPATDGEESGLFLEMISGPDSWHPEMPSFEKPLPLPLPAIVTGINDSDKVIQAGQNYWQAAEQILESIKKHCPDEDIANFSLIPPTRSSDSSGTSFRWSLLTDFAQVDPSIGTGVLVTNDVMVMNFHPQQAQQLAQSRSNEVFGPAKIEAPSLALMFYDHRVVMKNLKVWFEFAEHEMKKSGDLPDLTLYEAERDTLQFTNEQLKDIVERWWAFGSCFKGLSVRCYEESGMIVSEGLLKFEDIASDK